MEQYWYYLENCGGNTDDKATTQKILKVRAHKGSISDWCSGYPDVRYHISYCNIYAMHIYVSFIFKYILLSILANYIHLVQ